MAAVVLVNVGLALLVHHLAPASPRNSDRQAYEFVGRHAFEPNCGWSIYCYRVVVPLMLEQIPADPEQRWRWYRTAAVAAAGTVTSLTAWQVANAFAAGIIAAVIVQFSYGFSFTAYDPYTADPLVFLLAAVIAWCWLEDRWRMALVVGLFGIFVKETVALVWAGCVLAACVRRRATWKAWVAAGCLVGGALIAFRWVMDTYFGWGIVANPAAAFTTGSWLKIWWENNPSIARKLYMLLAPFGLAWWFAALGYPIANPALRQLAVASVGPILALCYVQTPERALANAFFVVVPLAALYLSRLPQGTGVAIALVNGLATAKIGSSSAWLPPSGYMLVAAVLLCGWSWSQRK